MKIRDITPKVPLHSESQVLATDFRTFSNYRCFWKGLFKLFKFLRLRTNSNNNTLLIFSLECSVIGDRRRCWWPEPFSNPRGKYVGGLELADCEMPMMMVRYLEHVRCLSCGTSNIIWGCLYGEMKLVVEGIYVCKVVENGCQDPQKAYLCWLNSTLRSGRSQKSSSVAYT